MWTQSVSLHKLMPLCSDAAISKKYARDRFNLLGVIMYPIAYRGVTAYRERIARRKQRRRDALAERRANA